MSASKQLITSEFDRRDRARCKKEAYSERRYRAECRRKGWALPSIVHEENRKREERENP